MRDSGTPQAESRAGTVLPMVAEFSFSLTPFFIATTAVVLWVIFFAAGAIINSQPYRDYLNGATVAAAVPAPPALSPATEAAPAPVFTSRADFDRAVQAAVAERASPVATPTSPAQTRATMQQVASLTGAFAMFMVFITYTPPNIAILAALSALVGAAARWMTDETSVESRRRLVDGRRTFFARRRRVQLNGADGITAGSLTAELESVSQELRRWASGVLLSALARGFFVYLSILSGLLVLTGDPFDSPTPGQYFRLAGTTSLFCFIVGWQPNFLAGLINRFASIAQTGPNSAGQGAAAAAAEAKTLTVTEAVTTTQTSTTIPTAPGATVSATAITVEPKAGPGLLNPVRPPRDN